MRLAGKKSLNVVPASGSELTSMRIWWKSAMDFTIGSPNPKLSCWSDWENFLKRLKI